jgi:phosphohistidine phosphatase
VPRLYLLRHAKSSWDDPALDDHDRPLSARGRNAAKKMSRHLRDAGVEPALVLCSSSVRTRQTFDRIASALPKSAEVRIEPSIYEAGADELLRIARSVAEPIDSAMLIGHNPGIQELAIMLVGGDEARLRDKFPTGALAALAFQGTWSDLGPGVATLEAFVIPRDLV